MNSNYIAVLFCILLSGFVIGGAFGLFGASVDPMSTVFGTETPTTKQVLKEMGKRCFSMGKSFAVIGMLIGGSECAIESVSVDSTSFYLLSFLGSSSHPIRVYIHKWTLHSSSSTGVAFEPNRVVFC
jgi:hypothetical protein